MLINPGPRIDNPEKEMTSHHQSRNHNNVGLCDPSPCLTRAPTPGLVCGVENERANMSAFGVHSFSSGHEYDGFTSTVSPDPWRAQYINGSSIQVSRTSVVCWEGGPSCRMTAATSGRSGPLCSWESCPAFDRVWDSTDALNSARVQLTSVGSCKTSDELWKWLVERSGGKLVSGFVIEACSSPLFFRRAGVAWSGGSFRGMEYRHWPQSNSLYSTRHLLWEVGGFHPMSTSGLRLGGTSIAYRQTFRSRK